MKIQFHLSWAPETASSNRKAFKFGAAHSLFCEYLKRISQFFPCNVSGKFSAAKGRQAATKVWVCDRGSGSRMLSSEELAHHLQQVMDSGTKQLHIVIGGPDGFAGKEIAQYCPDLRWSFGPLTLPHELAAVVASEQIYRALTILKHLPYHAGH